MVHTENFPGYNDPDSRKLLKDIEPWMINGRQLTLTAEQVMTVYLSLARYHDLEDFGFARDWEAIEAYCPSNVKVEAPNA